MPIYYGRSLDFTMNVYKLKQWDTKLSVTHKHDVLSVNCWHPKRKWTAGFFYRFFRQTAVMYHFSAVYQIAVVITDFRTVALAVISNTS